jgi:phosphotransferase system HPr (HPr) family protein
MTGFEHIIKNKDGIDCEVSSEISKESMIYTAEIKLEHGEKTINAKSFVALKSLGAKCGDKITITAEGEDERIAVQYLKKLVEKEL